MQQSTSFALSPYITSSFSKHSLLATTSVMSSLIGGLTKLPLAKIIDIWGRPHGYLLMVITLTVGLIMMAACQNVETYAAAQVFYWLGYVLSSLRLFKVEANRAPLVITASLMFSESSSPTRLR